MPTLVLLAGYPAAGKSTRRSLLAAAGYTVVCPDDIRRELTGSACDQTRNREVYAIAQERAAVALAAGQHVVIDATNICQAWRQPWYTLAERYGGAVQLDHIATPWLVCVWRNWRHRRSRARMVPLRVMVQMWLECDL